MKERMIIYADEGEEYDEIIAKENEEIQNG